MHVGRRLPDPHDGIGLVTEQMCRLAAGMAAYDFVMYATGVSDGAYLAVSLQTRFMTMNSLVYF